MEELIETIINYLIPVVLGSILGFLSTKVKKNKNKDKAIEEGVQALLRNELVRRYREYEVKGEMSILDKENIEDMFIQYEKLRRKWDCEASHVRIIRVKNKNSKMKGNKRL